MAPPTHLRKRAWHVAGWIIGRTYIIKEIFRQINTVVDGVPVDTICIIEPPLDSAIVEWYEKIGARVALRVDSKQFIFRSTLHDGTRELQDDGTWQIVPDPLHITVDFVFAGGVVKTGHIYCQQPGDPRPFDYNTLDLGRADGEHAIKLFPNVRS